MAYFQPVSFTGITFPFDAASQRYVPIEAEGPWTSSFILPATTPRWSRGLTGSGNFTSTSNYSLYVRQTYTHSSGVNSLSIPIRVWSSSSSELWGRAYVDVTADGAALPYSISLTKIEFDPDPFPEGTTNLSVTVGFYKTTTGAPSVGSSINIDSSDFIYFIYQFQVTKPPLYTYTSKVQYYSDNVLKGDTTITVKSLNSSLTTIPVETTIPSNVEMIADPATGTAVAKEGYYCKGWSTSPSATTVNYGGIGMYEATIPENTIPCSAGSTTTYNLYAVWQAAPEIYLVTNTSGSEATLKRVIQAKLVTEVNNGVPTFKDIDYGQIQISDGVWKQF